MTHLTHLRALVMMQLKDKLDFDFLSTTKTTISKVVFTVLKFAIVTAVAYLLFWLATLVSLLSLDTSTVPTYVMVFVFGLIFVLSVFSSTVGLMHSLYFADDNKVLITFPVNTNLLFLSKLVVFYVFELVRSYMFTVPIFIAFGIVNRMSLAYYPWIIFAFLFVSALPVLLGALLSIPAMYIYRFFKKVPVLAVILGVAAVGVLVFGVFKLINIIPANINLNQQYRFVQRWIWDNLSLLEKKFYPINLMVTMLCGYIRGNAYDLFVWQVPAYFGIALGALAALAAAAFFASRPLFFSMMSKAFEFEKKMLLTAKPNKKRPKLLSYLKTETTNLVRSGEFFGSVAVFVIVPILVFFQNKVFQAIDTSMSGMVMVYAFNLALTILPMLASNTMIASIYSKEGRAAHVKKTFPTSPLVPLTVKLLPSLVLSMASLLFSVVIMNSFLQFNRFEAIMIACSLVGLQWGHILMSASLDLMNPLYEQYATTGEVSQNPNENRSIIIAFITVVIYALLSFIFFMESNGLYTTPCLKLGVLGICFFLAALYMYCTKIKVYYYEK